ncbi:MAG: hypothetical protein J7K38_01575, partial [Thermoplasmata archaeon]|nr:hypothetical protein [Thermoplasmata archaeon]
PGKSTRIGNITEFHGGLVDEIVNLVYITINHSPTKPTLVSPLNGSCNVSTNPTLKVHVMDPDNDSMTVYFYGRKYGNEYFILIGFTNAENNSYASIEWSELDYSTTYEWYAVANDSRLENVSDTWTFTTQPAPSVNHPPLKPSNPSPANGATGVGIDVTLSWQCSDPDGDSLTYDVYFGKGENQLKKVSSNQSSTTYKPSTLNYSTTYYWKIIAWDEHGESSEGPVWRFTTEEEITNSPPTVSITKPENALYFRDRKILSLPLPFIIGPITVEVNASDSDGIVKKVEFYVDNTLKYSDTTAPFSWRWNSRAFGFKVIRIVAYDDRGSHQQSLKEVLIFNLAIL